MMMPLLYHRKKATTVLPGWVREISTSVRRVFLADREYSDDEDNTDVLEVDHGEEDVEMGQSGVEDSLKVGGGGDFVWLCLVWHVECLKYYLWLWLLLLLLLLFF